jgi:hypothetical protein
MKHVWIAIDQSMVENNCEAEVLGIFRKRKAAKAACEVRFATWPIGSRRKPRWRDLGALQEIYYHLDGTNRHPGLVVEKWVVQ